MKKIALLVLISFLFTPPIFATWTKDESNPIKISYQKEPALAPSSPSVLYENGIYKMWYQGYHDGSYISYAESFDGKNWEVKNPFAIQPSPEKNEIGTVEPMVIHRDKYYMWYNSFDSTYIYKIRYATSTDGLNWNVRQEPVLQASTSGWDRNGVTNPEVIYDNDIYKMWYISGSPWQLGYATSPDGISWTKYANALSVPTLGFIGGPTVLKIGETYHMWYHTGFSRNTNIYHVISTDGINWRCEDICSVLTNDPESFDSDHVVAPSVVKFLSSFKMWYGAYNGSQWQIGLATEKKDMDPIIFLPGFLASWNKEAILHNTKVSLYDWKLSPFITEYDGLISTFKKIGLQENEDYFIFPYDWRQNITNSAADLKTFIQDKILFKKPDKKVIIVGHSLGGLVGRIYTQDNQYTVSKLITIGSPHQGAVQAYKPLSSGDIERDNTLTWLAQKVILQLNKNLFKSDKDTIQNSFPVGFDLLPTFDFLRSQAGILLAIGQMNIKNDTLLTYNKTLSAIKDIFTIVYGNQDIKNTPSEYIYEEPSALDKALNHYEDGKPFTLILDSGDEVVLPKSSLTIHSVASYLLPLNHGELVYSSVGITTLLDILKLPYEKSQVIEGKKTVIDYSLIFLIQSPASMEVHYKNTTYGEKDGIIFIPAAESGDYTLQVTGNDFGKYTVQVGQMSKQNDTWDTIKGEITKSPPANQIDSYTIHYDNKISTSIFPSPTITSTPKPTEIVSSNSPSTSNNSAHTSDESAKAHLSTLTSRIQNKIKEAVAKLIKKSNPTVLGESTSRKNIHHNFLYLIKYAVMIILVLVLAKKALKVISK